MDSVKVRMQSAVNKVTFTNTIKSIAKNEGLLAFYKGLGPPMVTVPFINSIIFASYEFCKRLLGVVS